MALSAASSPCTIDWSSPTSAAVMTTCRSMSCRSASSRMSRASAISGSAAASSAYGSAETATSLRIALRNALCSGWVRPVSAAGTAGGCMVGRTIAS